MSASTPDTAKLRKVAEAATKGTWKWHGRWLSAPGNGSLLWYTVNDDGIHAAPEDENHIATFDPPTVLSLLDRLDALTAENERLRVQWETFLVRLCQQQARTQAAEAEAERLAEALMAVRPFVEAEVENRGAAGSDMSDYQSEARDALDRIDAALALSADPSREDKK